MRRCNHIITHGCSLLSISDWSSSVVGENLNTIFSYSVSRKTPVSIYSQASSNACCCCLESSSLYFFARWSKPSCKQYYVLYTVGTIKNTASDRTHLQMEMFMVISWNTLKHSGFNLIKNTVYLNIVKRNNVYSKFTLWLSQLLHVSIRQYLKVRHCNWSQPEFKFPSKNNTN